jgi:hypothetical protein
VGVRSVVTAISGAIAASLFGLLLPLAFAAQDSPALALVWLALSLLIGVCLLVTARPITGALAATLAGLLSKTEQSTWTPRATGDVARLLVAASYVVLLQAILRHPLVAVFGPEADPFLVEAVIGLLALLLVMALLSWMYAAAKPLLEGLATNVLDAAVATAPASAAPTLVRDTQATVLSPRRPASDDQATQLAPDAAATIRVESPADATELSG